MTVISKYINQSLLKAVPNPARKAKLMLRNKDISLGIRNNVKNNLYNNKKLDK